MASAHILAVAKGAPEEVIAQAKRRYDIVVAYKDWIRGIVEQSAHEVIAPHLARYGNQLQSYFEWCAQPQDATTRLARYEGFWSLFPPKQYNYPFHGTLIHLCAYRLVALYAENSNVKKCEEILQWLESSDERIPKDMRCK